MSSELAIKSITTALHGMGLTPLTVHLGNEYKLFTPNFIWDAPRIEFKGLRFLAVKVLKLLKELFSRSAIRCEWVLEGRFDDEDEHYWVMTLKKCPVKCRLWMRSTIKQDLRIIGMGLVGLHGTLRDILSEQVLTQAQQIENKPLEWRDQVKS